MEDHSHMDHSNHKMSDMDHSMLHNIVHGGHLTNETTFLENLSVSLIKKVFIILQI